MPKLYETITADNWGKGFGSNAPLGGRWCLRMRANKEDADEKIKATIQLLFPERCKGEIYLHEFNDHPDTTVEDVIRVCKVANV